jgi:small subunit ribosomal protein S16
VGTYNTLVEPSKFEVDKEKVLAWLKKGAIPSDTVRKMLGKIGVMKPVDFTNFKKRAPKSHGEGAKEEKTAETAPAQK